MNKWAQFTIGVTSAGAVQFGIMIGASATTGDINWTIVLAGVVGTMGATAGGLLKSLPKERWTVEKRASKLKKELT